MKHILKFFVYCWNTWQLWQKLIIASLILNVGSNFVAAPWNTYMAIAGLSIVAGMILTWWVTGMLIPKWREYKAKQNELLTQIKHSDQPNSNH